MKNDAFGRRELFQFATATAVTAASGAGVLGQTASPQVASSDAAGVEGLTVRYPRNRIPLSFIIDDSTCLVNMGHFCMPQFAQAWPEREIYRQDWRSWPREIPDSFVREFGEWCGDNGVKGKYSIVPYPACVGWLDRQLPGWSKQDLENSLALVRDLMMPNWDIHPEMITHTRVIDIKTGRPVEGANAATMENSYPQSDVSVDYLAEYLAYALRILKNCGLTCDGITTPGGFGNRVKTKLPIAVHQSVRDVFGSEITHYFKYVISGDQSTEPKIEYVNEGRSIDDLTVNVPAGTGDWFGSWEGVKPVQAERYCNEDATAGRMVELIQRGEPALMLCHWPGMYCNGGKEGFNEFQRVVVTLRERFGEQTLWMKLSEIARYWAAKEKTTFALSDQGSIRITSPVSCPDFTVALPREGGGPPVIQGPDGTTQRIERVNKVSKLKENRFVQEADTVVLCFSLSKGESLLSI